MQLGFNPVCRDSSKIDHCLFLISFCRSRFKPPTILDQLFTTTHRLSCFHQWWKQVLVPFQPEANSLNFSEKVSYHWWKQLLMLSGIWSRLSMFSRPLYEKMPQLQFQLKRYLFSVHNISLNFEAKFLVPDCGVIVDSGIGLSYRPASLCSLARGPVRQPSARVDYYPR